MGSGTNETSAISPDRSGVGPSCRVLGRVVKKKFFSFRVFFRKKTCFVRFFSLHPISSFLKTLLMVTVNL